MSNTEKHIFYPILCLLIAVLLAVLMYGAADIMARQECKAFGFEYGTLNLLPVQIRVPLREVFPPIYDPLYEGDNDGL